MPCEKWNPSLFCILYDVFLYFQRTVHCHVCPPSTYVSTMMFFEVIVISRIRASSAINNLVLSCSISQNITLDNAHCGTITSKHFSFCFYNTYVVPVTLLRK